MTNWHSWKIWENSLHMLSFRCFALDCVIWPLEKSNTSSLKINTKIVILLHCTHQIQSLTLMTSPNIFIFSHNQLAIGILVGFFFSDYNILLSKCAYRPSCLHIQCYYCTTHYVWQELAILGDLSFTSRVWEWSCCSGRVIHLSCWLRQCQKWKMASCEAIHTSGSEIKVR